jgi:uncharacterized protein YlxW (UPF0749 family)
MGLPFSSEKGTQNMNHQPLVWSSESSKIFLISALLLGGLNMFSNDAVRITRMKQAEQQRDSVSVQHVETLKQKVMRLRKENESLKRRLASSEVWTGVHMKTATAFLHAVVLSHTVGCRKIHCSKNTYHFQML